jgi:peroxiredoxin
LADYQAYATKFNSAGYQLAAVSVDMGERLQAVRRELGLDYPLLSDETREGLKAWGLLNPRSGGIALPAVVVIAPGMRVRLVAHETESRRLAPSALLRRLNESPGPAAGGEPGLQACIPRLQDVVNGVRNAVRFGLGAAKK